jgi:serine/threonine protein kinase
VNGPPVGPQIDGLTYIEHLGSGGYSDVHLYEQRRPKMRVAVKVLTDNRLSETELNRFAAEAETMAELADHPYIVQVFRTGLTDGGRPYLVMKYYPPPNLGVRAAAQRLTVAEVLRTGIQISSAVETAHRVGILHRDIKPANILVSQFGNPGLADFGIAGKAAETDSDDDLGVSIPWSPPEIITGQSNGSVASDVYSLAATLWHLLTGRSPYEVPTGDNSSRALIGRILRSAPPATGRADAPASFERLLQQGLAKDPQLRPVTALEFARQLQAVEQELRYSMTPIVVDGDAPVAPEARRFPSPAPGPDPAGYPRWAPPAAPAPDQAQAPPTTLRPTRVEPAPAVPATNHREPAPPVPATSYTAPAVPATSYTAPATPVTSYTAPAVPATSHREPEPATSRRAVVVPAADPPGEGTRRRPTAVPAADSEGTRRRPAAVSAGPPPDSDGTRRRPSVALQAPGDELATGVRPPRVEPAPAPSDRTRRPLPSRRIAVAVGALAAVLAVVVIVLLVSSGGGNRPPGNQPPSTPVGSDQGGIGPNETSAPTVTSSYEEATQTLTFKWSAPGAPKGQYYSYAMNGGSMTRPTTATSLTLKTADPGGTCITVGSVGTDGTTQLAAPVCG